MPAGSNGPAAGNQQVQMALSEKKLVKGAFWTIGAYGFTVCLRFFSNVILSRLVVPEVFGLMMILSTLKMGAELMTDVGIGQNIVRSANAEKQSFQNTAWTIQFVRGFVIFGFLSLAAYPLAQLYEIPTSAIALSALTVLVAGTASTSVYYLQRYMDIKRYNMLELTCDVASAILVIGLAFISPTIWSLIAANILAAALRASLSYGLPRAHNRFEWHSAYAGEIISFGKWMFLSSLLAFLCMNFDRLYLAQAIPLAIIGIYAIARTIAEIPAALVARLGHQLIFPLIAANQTGSREDLKQRVAPMRLKMLATAAFAIAFGIATADIAVSVIYDDRYRDAGWMLALLLSGAWFAILCSVNEYTVLGVGKPMYGVAGNATKFVVLLAGTPPAVQAYGLPGAILVIAASEILRYAPVLYGQRRERLSFFRQDLFLSLFLTAVLAGFLWLRWQLGLGTPFDAIGLHSPAP
jgi:O-antigen/teichoic acid export membrane protein